MFSTEPISEQTSTFTTLEKDSVTPQPCVPTPVIVKSSLDSLYVSRCMQLIWNEVDRLTLLGVIRSEEDKWFFAYRKAINIFSGEEQPNFP